MRRTASTLAEQLSPLVLEPDGMLVPLVYGLAYRYARGNILAEGWDEMVARWHSTQYAQFRRLCRVVYEEVTVEDEVFPFFIWYATLSAHSVSREVMVNC